MYTGPRYISRDCGSKWPRDPNICAMLKIAIARELRRGYIGGPFTSRTLPFIHYNSSPVFAIPKGHRKIRPIHDLTHGNNAINAYIDKDQVDIKLPRLSDTHRVIT